MEKRLELDRLDLQLYREAKKRLNKKNKDKKLNRDREWWIENKDAIERGEDILGRLAPWDHLLRKS